MVGRGWRPQSAGLPFQRPWVTHQIHSVTWDLLHFLFHTVAFNKLVTSTDCDAGFEELWSGVAFDPLEQTLSWDPACPVSASVTLCQNREDGYCVDLPHASQNVSREKVQNVEIQLFVSQKCPIYIGHCRISVTKGWNSQNYGSDLKISSCPWKVTQLFHLLSVHVITVTFLELKQFLTGWLCL